LWEGDSVTYQGRHYSIDVPVEMNPKPISRPLPTWIAGGAVPAIERAAKMADGWVIAPGSTPKTAKEGIAEYKGALEKLGRDVADMSIVLRRDAHLSPMSAAGHREAQTLFENGYRGFGVTELEESLVVGGPDDCIKYLEEMQSAGVTEVLFRCALDERELALQTITTIGKEVVPHFRR
jgi:alkanesulfonate monooxygenase SsuD/methylene tetrahydromethanopterin reductase-like flavin-dependent oxidoreductase (luciferase family)